MPEQGVVPIDETRTSASMLTNHQAHQSPVCPGRASAVYLTTSLPSWHAFLLRKLLEFQREHDSLGLQNPMELSGRNRE